MSISLRPEHLKRYKDLAWLLIKYGRSDLTSRIGLDQSLEAHEKPAESVGPEVEELASDLERLGPTYMKLGQFLSTRSDMIPPEYLAALARLQDKAERFPYPKVEEIITAELGVRISRVFPEFEREPIAAASLAQVHRATLRNGRAVAVKVQRPDIRESIVKDLDAFHDIAEFLDRHTYAGKLYRLEATLEEFRRALLRELDFRLEAQNLGVMRENLKEYHLIVIPAALEDYTTSRVLTMDYIKGRNISEVSPLSLLEVNGKRLAEELFRAYLQQVLIDGFYHADPHPGNVILTDDGRLGLVDLGMTARISPLLQKILLRLLLAMGEGRTEEAVEYAVELGEKVGEFKERQFARRVNELIARHQNVTMREIAAGHMVMEFFQIAGENGIRFPTELAMLGKTLLNLDNITRALDPTFDPNAALRHYAAHLFREKMRKEVSASSFYEALMEAKEVLQLLPKRMNRIMEVLAGNELRLRVDSIDEKYLMTGLQKIANRLTAGIILAAVIVGAAMLMQVDTPFKLFGYPGIAIIFFILAALGGLWLAFSIIFHDERTRKKDLGPRK
jgi:predicted unusual protein kinase regulating ubiquinone biosynthesis (AarF/ABC1/UbiB family)